MYIRYTSLWRSCGSFKIWNSLRHSIGRRTRSEINVKFKTNVHRLLAITFSSVPARRCISRVSTVWYYMVISYLVMAHLANHGIRILWWTDSLIVRWFRSKGSSYIPAKRTTWLPRSRFSTGGWPFPADYSTSNERLRRGIRVARRSEKEKHAPAQLFSRCNDVAGDYMGYSNLSIY